MRREKQRQTEVSLIDIMADKRAGIYACLMHAYTYIHINIVGIYKSLI